MPQPEALDPDSQRQRLFTALTRAILSPNQPLLLVIDDLQWCDRETLAWLNYLLHREETTRLLLVGTTRSEEIGPDHLLESLVLSLRGAGRAVEIELGPLSASETSVVARQIARQELTADVLAHLHRETEGNPLFVVEAMRANLQSLPPRVQAVIQARLTNLSPMARDLVGIAAVIGREFTFDVLVQASKSDEDTLVRSLDELWQRRIIREQGTTAYDFSHDKIRDVAQAQLSAVKQKMLHRRVAQALEAVYAADLDSMAGQIALHYERASLTEQAIAYYQRAAEVARRVYANAEIVSHLNRALDLLALLPPGRERDERELAMLTALGPPLVALKGYLGQDVLDTYSRARDISQWLGLPPHPPTLRALAIALINQGEHHQAHDLGGQLLALGQQSGDNVPMVEGHYVLGVTLFWLAQFAESRRHLEQALACFSPGQCHVHIELFAQDPQVICLSRLAWTLWYLGYPDQAATTMQQALTQAQASAHPLSYGYALWVASFLSIDLREDQSARNLTRAVLALSTKSDLGNWRLPLAVVLEAIAPESEHTIDSISRMHLMENQRRKLGWLNGMPFMLALIAKAAHAIDETQQAQALMNEALEIVRETEETFYEAELHRLKGEVSLRMDAVADAEQSFQHALAIAREQQAKSLELRAAMSLARLWQAQGRPAEAYQLLASVYSWFTEGFDTLDLREARALLAALESVR